jgi:hypothetical protein
VREFRHGRITPQAELSSATSRGWLIADIRADRYRRRLV